MLLTTSMKTPVGSLQLIAHEHVLLAAGFGPLRELVARLDKSDFELGLKAVKEIPIISDLIKDYFDGDFAALNGIKVRQPGAEFSQAVWKAVRNAGCIGTF